LSIAFPFKDVICKLSDSVNPMLLMLLADYAAAIAQEIAINENLPL
jgi:hypothetical protein